MLLLLLMGLTLAAASAVLVARAALFPRLRGSQTLGRIGSYGFAARHGDEDSPSSATRSAADSVAASGGTGAGLIGGPPGGLSRRELVAAGIYGLAPRKFVGYRVLSTIVAPACWL